MTIYACDLCFFNEIEDKEVLRPRYAGSFESVRALHRFQWCKKKFKYILKRKLFCEHFLPDPKKQVKTKKGTIRFKSLEECFCHTTE